MSLRENLRRGRSHLLLVAVMLITAWIVISLDERELASETAALRLETRRTLPQSPASGGRSEAPQQPQSKLLQLPASRSETAATETIQLGAYAARDWAVSAWPELAKRHPELASLEHEVIAVTVDSTPIFRLRASGAGARSVCTRLSAEGLDCFALENRGSQQLGQGE